MDKPDYMVDHYAVLGLERNADPAQIKTAFRELSSQWHPDKYAHLAPQMQAEATQRTRYINEAYQLLHDADKKAKYDQQLAEFDGPISTTGVPIVVVSLHARQTYLHANPEERERRLSEMTKHAIALSGYDQSMVEFIEQQYQHAKQSGQPIPEQLKQARRDALRRWDAYLLAQEVTLRPYLDMPDVPNEMPDDGYLELVAAQAEDAYKRFEAGVDTSLKQLAEQGMLALPPGSSGADETQDTVLALADQRRQVMESFHKAYQRVQEVAAKREHIAEHRRAMIEGEYLPADQPRHERVAIQLVFSSGAFRTSAFQVLRIADQLTSQIVPLDGAVEGDTDLSDLAAQERLLAEQISVMRFSMHEDIAEREQVEILVTSHFEPLLEAAGIW